MTKFQKISLFCSRIIIGWMFFWAGITKVIDPKWSADFYLKGAKLLPGFYGWLLDPAVLPCVNFVNEWGLTLLGVSLILGIGVRLSSILGAILMLLYYIPLGFPYPNPHAYIVDEHIVYMAILIYFASIRAGRFWGLDNMFSNSALGFKYPWLRDWLS